MKVLKFGGTSVGSVNSILSVKKIVEAIEEPVIVVVSALGGITDKLLATSTMASKGDLAYEKELSEIIARHLDVIEGVIADKEVRMDVQKKVMALLDELSNIFKGVYLINDLSAKTADTIVSYGERLSSLIVSNVIKDAKLFDSRKYIKTVKQFNKHIVDFDLTNKLIKETFSPLPKVSLVPGFISSSTETGEVTNLGRGGSDYTASILATALDANTLEIWTDVDGFMTADPRVISSAYVIDRLTFTEAMELCNFGAKVIYPPTIYPVYHKNIPIRILNTFNPTAPGTYISKERVKEEGKAIIKGISSINDTCLITVQGLGMVGVIGVNYRIFKTLAKNGISVFMVSQASSENNTTFAVRNADADLAVQVLNDEFALERAQGDMNDTVAEKDLATVAIVGENMKRNPGIDGKLLGLAADMGGLSVRCRRLCSALTGQLTQGDGLLLALLVLLVLLVVLLGSGLCLGLCGLSLGSLGLLFGLGLCLLLGGLRLSLGSLGAVQELVQALDAVVLAELLQQVVQLVLFQSGAVLLAGAAHSVQLVEDLLGRDAQVLCKIAHFIFYGHSLISSSV